MNETVKTYAIGAVIDNVRDTFDTINEDQSWEFSWFHLDNNTPVEKIWNDLIISGSFNGSNVKVRYNLETWELFMNSFLRKLSPSKISIGESSSIDYPIWMIKPFNDVLNDYYKFPPRSSETNDEDNKISHSKRQNIDSLSNNHEHYNDEADKNDSHLSTKPSWRPLDQQIEQANGWNIEYRKQRAKEVLNSQLGLIGNAIKLNTENQAQKNSAITEFMKTFNVTSNSRKFNNLDFNDGSNLFNVIQILPELRIFSNSETGVFFTIPFFVANNKKLVSWFLLIDISELTVSSFSNCNKFTIGIPLAVLLNSGTS